MGELRHGTFPSPPLGNFTHVGVDIVAPCGSNIYAFADGQVKDIIDNTNDENFNTLGYMVLIEHPASLIGKTFYTLFLHMQSPPDVAKLKTKYGEIEVNIDTITSFNKGVLILNDQSKLSGSFTDGNITIKTSYAKFSLPISEIIAISTEATTTPSQEITAPTQGTKSTVKRLSRDKAKEVLKNLVTTKRWCAFPGKCPDKSISIPNVYGFYLEASSAGIEVSRETLISYLSCLENKGLVKNLSVKKGRKEGFSGWDAWFETTTTGEPWQLTEMGQKYLTDNLDYSLQVAVDKITGIQFSNEYTVTKVFFDATIKSSNNPFNKCFEDYFDVHSLLNYPYALFELFDDGWRVKEWHSGGKLKERVQPSTKQLEKTTASANTDKSDLILGRHEHEAGVIEYFVDGTFMLHMPTGEYKKRQAIGT